MYITSKKMERLTMMMEVLYNISKAEISQENMDHMLSAIYVFNHHSFSSSLIC